YGKDDKETTPALSTTRVTPTANSSGSPGSGHCEFCLSQRASTPVRRSPWTIRMRTGRISTNS
ncbi:hypothetical protein LTS18_001217, partial [Coniosporium uncinatum]